MSRKCCSKQYRRLAHDYRWTRSDDGVYRTRWVHGWHIHITGYAAPQWKNACIIEIANRLEFVDNRYSIGRIVVTRKNVPSVEVAMTNALAIVHALKSLRVGMREYRSEKMKG